LLASSPSTLDADVCTLQLSPNKNNIFLQNREHTDIAILDSNTVHAFQAIEGIGAARYEVFITLKELSKCMGTWKKSGKHVPMPLEIVVYGDKSDSKRIGKCLSDSGLFLQHPRSCSGQATYDNPHFLNIKHLRNPQLKHLSPSLTPMESGGASSLSDEFASILNSLDQQDALKDIIIDRRIKTELLR